MASSTPNTAAVRQQAVSASDPPAQTVEESGFVTHNSLSDTMEDVEYTYDIGVGGRTTAKEVNLFDQL